MSPWDVRGTGSGVSEVLGVKPEEARAKGKYRRLAEGKGLLWLET